MLACLTTGHLSDDKDIEMHILADKPAAHIDVEFLGLVFLLSAAFDDIGADRIGLVVILIDVLCEFAQCGADGFVGRFCQRVFRAASGDGAGGDIYK